MRGPAIFLGVLLLAPLALADQAAREELREYVLATEVVMATALGTNVGGAIFFPQTDETSVTVHVFDYKLGSHVRITACQDLDDLNGCGDVAAGEPRVEGCGTVTLAGIHADERVTVFVHGVETMIGGCNEHELPTGGVLAAYFR